MTPTPLQRRFLQSIEAIEAQLLSPMSLSDAAKAAGFSPAYYSRLFRALTGEPFGSYLRRRRMAVAAERLRSEGRALRLIDLAFESGYDSQEAFTRAFKRTFGRTPGKFRESPVRSTKLLRTRIGAAELIHLSERLAMEPRIEEIASFTAAGVRERIDSESTDRIPSIWGRFMERLPRIPHLDGDSCVGLSLNVDLEDGSFDYVAGIPVSRVGRLPEGVIAETVPAETYAIFTHRVEREPLHVELDPTYRWIFGTWLPASPWEYGHPLDFERYPANFDPGRPGETLEICVPIRPRTGE